MRTIGTFEDGRVPFVLDVGPDTPPQMASAIRRELERPIVVPDSDEERSQAPSGGPARAASAARLRLLRGAYGGDYPRCDDDPFFADKDGEGCAAYGVKPAFSCGHEGYEGSCKSCCATCSGMPKCELLAAKAPEAEGAPKDEV